MPETANELSPLAAYEELMRFAKVRGEAALRLAMHAAVPQGIDPELLHLLKRNFVPEAGEDPTIEADILFSPLCEELGRGYFRFDPQVRALLLENLAFNYADQPEPRIAKVADFLLAYVDHSNRLASSSQDQLYRDYLETQRWVAFAFADPLAAAQQLAAAIENASSASDVVARMQLGGLASALASPLSNFPHLLNYAAGVQALELGDRTRAGEFFDTLQDDELKIGNTTLRSTKQILDEWQERHPEYAATTEKEVQSHQENEVENLLELLASSDIDVRTVAAQTAGLLKTPAKPIIRALFEGLNDQSTRFRRECVRALANIGSQEALMGVASAIADAESEVGGFAAAVLRELGRSTVLIIGVFEDEFMVRTIREELVKHNYLPVFFDRPPVSLSRFVEIAGEVEWVLVDVAAAQSDMVLLRTLTPFSIPVQPIARRGAKVGFVFKDLERDPAVLNLLTYNDVRDLGTSLEKLAIPAIQARNKRRSQQPESQPEQKPNFKYDIFISCAHVDNQGPTPDTPGLIDVFAERLSIRLAQLIGEAPSIFRDMELVQSEAFSEKFREAINQSAVFVAVISDAYLRSEWCVRELDQIVVTESESRLNARFGRRLFLASMRPYPPEQIPPLVRGLVLHELLEDAYERPYLQLQTEKFAMRLDALASDMFRVLQPLRTPRAVVAAQPLATIYLAETTRELRGLREDLKQTLEAKGYHVLPDHPLPITAEEFKKAVQDYLLSSNLSIHLFGEKYGSYPDGGSRSMPELQFELASNRIGDPTFSRIVWMPKGVTPESKRQQDLFRKASTESRDLELAQTKPEDLEQVILQRLAALTQQASEPPIQTDKPASQRGSAIRERWPVRTGIDQDVSKVNRSPLPTSIEELIARERPIGMKAIDHDTFSYHSKREQPAETTTWLIDAQLKAFKLNQSGSYRLILGDDNDLTIGSEVPDPSAVDESSPWRESFSSVRRSLEEKIRFTKGFHYLTPPPPVRVTGVGFFSRPHGQKHAAPNGIELQPILEIEWLPEQYQQSARPGIRPTIFIGYSHEDEKWKNLLLKQLSVLQQQDQYIIWTDREIGAGEDWYQTINDDLGRAQVALLLISVDFLASGFIFNNEVSMVLERQEKKGLRIIPIIVGDCAWEGVKWLARMEVRPRDGRSLRQLRRPRVDRELKDIVLEVAQTFSRPSQIQ